MLRVVTYRSFGAEQLRHPERTLSRLPSRDHCCHRRAAADSARRGNRIDRDRKGAVYDGRMHRFQDDARRLTRRKSSLKSAATPDARNTASDRRPAHPGFPPPGCAGIAEAAAERIKKYTMTAPVATGSPRASVPMLSRPRPAASSRRTTASIPTRRSRNQSPCSRARTVLKSMASGSIASAQGEHLSLGVTALHEPSTRVAPTPHIVVPLAPASGCIACKRSPWAGSRTVVDAPRCAGCHITLVETYIAPTP